MSIKEAIEKGSVEELGALLADNPQLANTRIEWEYNQPNTSDPLHFVSDCVFHGSLKPADAVELSKVLLQHGAEINGSVNAETPLIGAVSLSVASVAHMLINAKADIHATSVHGATALHWAAYVGLPDITKLLIERGAKLEQKCTSFAATPLFWSAHAVRYGAATEHSGIVAAARILVNCGAKTDTTNHQGYKLLQLAIDTGNQELIDLIG